MTIKVILKWSKASLSEERMPRRAQQDSLGKRKDSDDQPRKGRRVGTQSIFRMIRSAAATVALVRKEDFSGCQTDQATKVSTSRNTPSCWPWPWCLSRARSV
jgi:hypothetical protein